MESDHHSVIHARFAAVFLVDPSGETLALPSRPRASSKLVRDSRITDGGNTRASIPAHAAGAQRSGWTGLQLWRTEKAGSAFQTLSLPAVAELEKLRMGRKIIPVPTDVRCPNCGGCDIRSFGTRPLWSGERAPQFRCATCKREFVTAVIPKREKKEKPPRPADVEVREEARRGKLTITLSMHPKILARLVSDCSSLGIANMHVYFAMLGECRHAELMVKQQINAPEKTDGRFRGWHRNSYPEKSSTSQALAVVRSKSEACRIGQMHLTHRRAAQEQP
jgi:DNA-directed RNA polymerase subunit RPC12/RpoP